MCWRREAEPPLAAAVAAKLAGCICRLGSGVRLDSGTARYLYIALIAPQLST